LAPQFSEGKELFGSSFGVLKYVGGLHLSFGLMQMSIALRKPFYVAVALGFIALHLVGSSFRFVWRRANWFRVALVGQVLLQFGFGCAALGLGRNSLSAWGIIVGMAFTLLRLPGQAGFCKRYGIPTDKLNQR
jgi:hypothetical protein